MSRGKIFSVLRAVGVIVIVAALGGVFYLRAAQNLSNMQRNSANSNFFFFWLAGRMVLDGENPYDEAQYLAGHDAYGVTWKPNRIFPYPLPLALFVIPLGLMSLSDAYLAWQIISQAIVALTVFILLSHWKEPAHRRLFLPVMIFLLFFGPLYLALQTGAISAFALLVILVSLLLFENKKTFWAGLILSLTILKPPQGLTILFLIGVWSLARRDWKAIQGMAVGGIALALIGFVQDPLWIVKFRAASQAVMDRTLGVHSNVWAYAYLICNGTSPCSALLGAAGCLILLGVAGFFLWKNQSRLSEWEAFNVVIPVAFVSTIYLWAYDQLPYVIPIIWIVGVLVERKKSYIHAFIFLIVLTLVSLSALILHAFTLRDVWSLGNTLVTLGMTFALLRGGKNL